MKLIWYDYKFEEDFDCHVKYKDIDEHVKKIHECGGRNIRLKFLWWVKKLT